MVVFDGEAPYLESLGLAEALNVAGSNFSPNLYLPPPPVRGWFWGTCLTS
jgi:hypothetical protein